MICGLTGLAGSTKIGNGCVLAGQVGSAGHLTVGDGAVITSRSGIPGDVPPGAIYSGYPAVENKLWLKISAALSRLPDMVKRVRELEAEIKELKTR
jgi:UDP-3-O-[3-hydroxymyristoyl] glucosamine N-acyltransferase